MEIESKLISIETPPKDSCGYYGLVLKPKYMPLCIARILKNYLKIREGWLNMPRAHFKPDKGWDERWWFDYSNGRENSERCNPIFWCKIKTYYKVKVTPNGNNPFYWRVEDPKGSYRIAE